MSNPTNIEDDITNCMNDLKLGMTGTNRTTLRIALLANGTYNPATLSDVTSHLKANRGKWDTITVSTVVDAYNRKVNAVSVDCEYCRGGGWLKVILLEGVHRGYEKTWIFNYRDQDKQLRYLKTNDSFKARAAILPCTCGNGSNRNIKNKREWLSDDMRVLALSRSIRYTGNSDNSKAYEDYYQQQTIDQINGKIDRIKDIEDYLKESPSVQDLQNKLKQAMEV